MAMNQPSQPSLPPIADLARLHATDECPSCRRAALRLHEAEAASDGLRCELALGARRLRLAMGQLASAEDRAGHRAVAGTIRSVAAGQSNLSFDDALALLGAHGSARARAGADVPAQRLAAREREVLRLITEGHRTPAIAASMGIAAAAVEVHRRNIMRKLGLHTVAALTNYALREGLISL